MPSRIGDFLIRGDFNLSESAREGKGVVERRRIKAAVASEVAGAHPVLLDQIAKMHIGDANDVRQGEFPCAVLPWEHAWFEWKFQNKDFHPKLRLSGDDLRRDFGSGIEMTQESRMGWQLQAFQDPVSGYRYTFGMAWAAYDHVKPMDMGISVEMVTDDRGESLPQRYYQDRWSTDGLVYDHWAPWNSEIRHPRIKSRDDLGFSVLSDMAQSFWICVFAMSLLNCKNVTTRELPLGRRREVEVEKQQRLRFSTIELHSPSDHCGTESDPHQPPAVHLCRGHFKDYREHGLGKNRVKGVWWWNQHARGNADRGVVVSTHSL